MDFIFHTEGALVLGVRVVRIGQANVLDPPLPRNSNILRRADGVVCSSAPVLADGV